MKKMEGFSVIYRNPGHWDIYTEETGRAFCIRGTKGNYFVRDERPGRFGSIAVPFKTVTSCMSYIGDELMCEDISDVSTVEKEHEIA